ncbi:MAG: hypothetical protein HN816_07540 [Gammaproteobacteria bacterium]|nr:hypothetical protein [Gammaproteobacteria bacterium]
MMEIIIYTASGIFLYVLADAALNYLESLHGEPIPHRSVVFFVIIFIMAMILFPAVQLIFNGVSGP